MVHWRGMLCWSTSNVRLAFYSIEPGLTFAGFTVLHEKIMQTEVCSPQALADPTKWSELPFPNASLHLPRERFKIDAVESTFPFMGRKVFTTVYQKVLDFPGTSRSILSLQGAAGSGKSHILAALTCLLMKEGKRVVYMPDVREFAASMVGYLRNALLLAYAPNPELCEIIFASKTISSLVEFVRERSGAGEAIYIICDQMNALDHDPTRVDRVDDERKDLAMSCIDDLVTESHSIWSASGNCGMATTDNCRQTSGAQHIIFRYGYQGVCSILKVIWGPC